MNWILALGAIVLVVLLLARRRRKAGPGARPAPPPPANRRPQDLKPLEGAVCIHEEGNTVLKARLLQVEESGERVMFTLQFLRAEGLTEIPDESFHLEATWSHLTHSSKLIHATYAGWKLFFDRQLIQKVQELGLAHTDIKAIKRVLLEHQMK